MSSGSGSAVPTIKSYKQDGKTTYCYYMDGVKYTENLATIKPSDITARGVGSECPIQLTVTYPLRVTARSVIPLSMKAVVNDKTSVPKGFQFTFPVSKAVVPEALRATSNNASANGLPLDKAQFDIAVANFGICDYRNCDIFTDFTNIQGNYYPSSNNPQNFDTRVATFGSNEIQIPRESKYTGFAHIVVSVAGIARSDYVSFFPIQVGDLPGTQPGTSIVADSKTTYCWVSRGVSPFEPRLEDAGLIVRMNNNCPGTMIAALSKSSVLVGENVNLQYSMQLDGTRDPTTIVGEVSGTTTVKDPDTGIYSEVPIAVFSSCLQNLDDPKKTCSTYSGGNSRTTDITTWRDQNLTAGAVTYSSSHSFDSAGQYLIISRVVMVTTDGDRIDMAVYSTLQVTIPASSSGSLFLYLGLGIGALILLLGFLFCFMRKRRQRNKMKQIPFRTPMPPGSTHERTSQYTTTSSHFVTHRSPQMHNFPVAYPQHENNPYYPSDKNQYEPRQDSFSLDPYGRNSFNEMGEDESLDMTIRPSDASKFSFQTGYDDQSDFDYDTSYRSNAQSEYSNGTRGTFHLHPNGPSQMPIMEEDDRRYQQKYGGWNMRS